MNSTTNDQPQDAGANISIRTCKKCRRPSGGGDLCPSCELDILRGGTLNINPPVDQVPEAARLTDEEMSVSQYHRRGYLGYRAVAEAATEKAFPMGYQAGRESRDAEVARLQDELTWKTRVVEDSRKWIIRVESERHFAREERDAAQAQLKALVEALEEGYPIPWHGVYPTDQAWWDKVEVAIAATKENHG